MGEAADDMIEGRACSLCGAFFVDPKKPDRLDEHGYPVVCRDCWKALPPDQRKQYQRATAETL